MPPLAGDDGFPTRGRKARNGKSAGVSGRNAPLRHIWCPRPESNQGLMLTRQLHDLHATGARWRIIAEGAWCHAEQAAQVNSMLCNLKTPSQPMDDTRNQLKSLSLLIVEDSEDDALLLLQRFRAAGYKVHFRRVDTAADMQAALQTEVFDAVLSDHRMPAFDANGALALMQALDRDLPFIIVSGVIDEETAISAMRAGAHDYLSKDKLHRLVPAVEREIREAINRTERRAALDAVRESESRYRTLATNLPGMVFQMRLNGNVLQISYASEGCVLLLGLEPDQVSRNSTLFLEMIEAEDRRRLDDALARSRGAGTNVNWEGRIRFASGEIKWINMRAAPRQDSSGERLWEGIMSNITLSKRNEAELRESREQLRELQLHLERVREEERERIARDIHDVLGGNLVAIKIEASLLESKLEADPQALRKRVQSIAQLIDDAIATSGRVARELRPGILKEFGLPAAIECQAEDFSQRTGLTCHCRQMDYDAEVSEDASIALFRVFQEALTNIAKHAQASRVDVALTRSDDSLELLIRDDGRGIAPADMNKPRSFGLRGMRERMASLGGSARIGPCAEGGTEIVLRAPLVQDASR